MAEQLLPHGLLGLVLVGFFSHTMAMCSSDANAIAAVFTRDMLPGAVEGRERLERARRSCAGRGSPRSLFLGLSMAIAATADTPRLQ